ncbi:hypothetical protein UT300012_21670 [Paraclostridium bifermentans]
MKCKSLIVIGLILTFGGGLVGCHSTDGIEGTPIPKEDKVPEIKLDESSVHETKGYDKRWDYDYADGLAKERDFLDNPYLMPLDVLRSLDYMEESCIDIIANDKNETRVAKAKELNTLVESLTETVQHPEGLVEDPETGQQSYDMRNSSIVPQIRQIQNKINELLK